MAGLVAAFNLFAIFIRVQLYANGTQFLVDAWLLAFAGVKQPAQPSAELGCVSPAEGQP